MSAEYTPEQRTHAVEMHRVHGPKRASAMLGIPERTIKMWAKHAGVASEAATNLTAAVATARAKLDQRMTDLAGLLVEDAHRLRTQLWEPTVERKVVVVSVGPGFSESQIVDVHRDEPTFAEKKSILVGVAIIVDKVQVIRGEQPGQLRDDRDAEALAQDVARVVRLGDRRAASA